MAKRTSGKSISQTVAGSGRGRVRVAGGTTVNGRFRLGEKSGAGGNGVRISGKRIKEPISTRGSKRTAATAAGAASRTAPIPH